MYNSWQSLRPAEKAKCVDCALADRCTDSRHVGNLVSGSGSVCFFLQDKTIRWVMEYSTDPSFENVPPLNLQLPIFDKTAAVSSDGVDLANDFDLDVAGRVKGGRFVFTKLTPFDEFKFPKTRVLENGVLYYFKNYKVRDGCVSPPLNTHSVYPSEVMTRPSILQVMTPQSMCVYIRVPLARGYVPCIHRM